MSRRLLQLVIPVTPERRMFRIHDPSVDPDAPGGPLPPVGALISTNREQLWVGSLQEDIDVRLVLEEWDESPPPSALPTDQIAISTPASWRLPSASANAGSTTSIAPNEKPTGSIAMTIVCSPGDRRAPAQWRSGERTTRRSAISPGSSATNHVVSRPVVAGILSEQRPPAGGSPSPRRRSGRRLRPGGWRRDLVRRLISCRRGLAGTRALPGRGRR